MVRKQRTTPGMLTVVNKELRIRNGDVESLRKMKKRGRPKKPETLSRPVPGIPEYPQFADVKDADITFKDSYRLIRTEKSKNAKKAANKALQTKFDDLASEVREPETFGGMSQTVRLERWYDGSWGRFDYEKQSRTEWPVPGSFCNCKSNNDEEYMPCIVHGLKQPDCDCGGIDGLNGYRVCSGHRSSGQGKGVPHVLETDRMREARESADSHAREAGWM